MRTSGRAGSFKKVEEEENAMATSGLFLIYGTIFREIHFILSQKNLILTNCICSLKSLKNKKELPTLFCAFLLALPDSTFEYIGMKNTRCMSITIPPTDNESDFTV
jgi:hypothetical protein